MGSCISIPTQPSSSSSLFPGIYATKSTEPSVIVLRPPTRPSTSISREEERYRPRSSVEVRAIDAARDADAKATADLAETQFKATATCAAQATAAAAAISLQIAMMSVETPKMLRNSDAKQEKDQADLVPSTVVSTEAIAPVVLKQTLQAPPIPPAFIQIPDGNVTPTNGSIIVKPLGDNVDGGYGVESNNLATITTSTTERITKQ